MCKVVVHKASLQLSLCRPFIKFWLIDGSRIWNQLWLRLALIFSNRECHSGSSSSRDVVISVPTSHRAGMYFLPQVATRYSSDARVGIKG